jgi:Mg2+ and Co2+ transporter CorA
MQPKIAQSQLEIVYNLVAQQDNKDNMEMAKLQTQESFTMCTIAVMSIFFLPGTFVSSFFSMDMFNWGAPKGSPVVSPRFWIYWVVTVPLTLVVLMIWSIWLQKHHKHET